MRGRSRTAAGQRPQRMLWTNRSSVVSASLWFVCVIAAAVPAAAQVSFVGDFSGRYHEDQPDRVPGEEPGNMAGIPVNDAARMYADSWNEARYSVLEHQCAPYVLPYLYFGPNQVRIWETRHPDTQETGS